MVKPKREFKTATAEPVRALRDFVVPCMWSVHAEVHVKAHTAKEAVEKVRTAPDMPKDGEISKHSFEVLDDSVEDITEQLKKDRDNLCSRR